ncbi:TPA: ATP-binding protein [Enterobacter asburiae]|nr:ATP-binding protein [Enterobacter asburiae]
MRIEQRLRKLADENPNYSLLWAQWEFDKKLLSRALNTISRDFPHYSLHDSSHSSTIITQIEKIISPNIDDLSATDCWLLLESCYWHDAGMVITNEEKKNLLSDQGFLFYLQELSCQNSELSCHAKEILESKDENDIEKALNISNSLTFIIADYFRTLHANRSGVFVNEPTRINVFSPRTSLIPQRLFNFVAQIVQCHGKDYSAILDLAKYNDGMDAEDYAHPRYIAALLRIGDLLDIDDGRFCPTLLANIGDRPISSYHHHEKHASIKHLLINSEVIEIKAECEHYGAYHVQQGWFNYIQNEFDYQKRIWNEIVPKSEYRALPTIGVLECSIKGYIAIDGKIPKITLDPKRVYDYITGSQIYSEKYPFVRELLQNSIDATYYKIWDDLFSTDMLLNNDESDRTLFKKALGSYKIELNCKQVNSDKGKDNAFIIRDYATGMDLNDIKKILVVGSEPLPSIKKIKRSMPDWAKPSGYFGIGLQTVFKLCREVIIKTRKRENSCYEINILNHNDSSLYDISVKEVDDKRFEGTEIKAIFENDNESSEFYNHKSGQRHYDPLLLEKNNIFHQIVREMLSQDFSKSDIMITLNNEVINEKRENTNVSNNIYLSDYVLGIDFNLKIDLDADNYPPLIYRFKGVEFDTRQPIEGLVGEIDIFRENAGYWLTIDRKQGRTDKYDEIYKIFKLILTKHSDYLRLNTNDDKLSDFYLYSKTSISKNGLWKYYEIKKNTVDSYFYGGERLYVYENKYSYIPDPKFNDIDMVEMRLLSDIFRNESLSLAVEICDEKLNFDNADYFDDETEKNSLVFSFTFSNDNNARFYCPATLLQEEIKLNKKDKQNRTYIPCYDEIYNNISITRDNLPKFIYAGSSFNRWAYSFIFTPQYPYDIENFNLEEELSRVYCYYLDLGLVVIPEDDFKDKYRQCWEELSLIPA